MRLLIAAAALSLIALTSVASATPEQTSSTGCFWSTSWQGWSAPGDGDTLLLRVNHDVYSVGLTPGTHARKSGDRFLINRLQGSSIICSPLDLNLTLSDRSGFHQPLIATSLRKLTDEEVAAIPAHDRP